MPFWWGFLRGHVFVWKRRATPQLLVAGNLDQSKKDVIPLYRQQALSNVEAKKTKQKSSAFLSTNGLCSRRLAISAMLVIPAAVKAQFRVEVSGIGANRIPIAIATLKGERFSAFNFTSIVGADLERSGQFNPTIDAESSLNESAQVDTAAWRSRGMDALVCGSVNRLASGQFSLSVRIWDTISGRDLGGQNLTVNSGDARLAAHRIADFIYSTLTGVRGVFSTRIAYITKEHGKYNVQVADADGFDRQSALSSTEPIISPTWSPDGTRLAYVSFESQKPVVYVHELATGKRRLVANFKGSNSAPGWAPDGGSLAVTLTQDGVSQIYVIDLLGNAPAQRVMRSASIDTEAKFSADGKTLYFVSDRGGSPQIYKIRIENGEVDRVTFEGSYNISPAISADGKWLAYIARINDEFKLRVMDVASGVSTTITDTVADESPCFAPNSRMIMYATQIAGVEALMTSSIDGAIKTRLAGSMGDIREPAWGPYERFST